MSSILPLTLATNTCYQIPGLDPWHADPQDPALTVMTDFRERASVTVPETASIDEALEHMRHTGVRCAFAIDDRRSIVVGLITAYDVTGERPMQFMQAEAIPRREVQVRDIMREISECPVADIKQIERATVAAVSNMFAKKLLTHVPVVVISGQVDSNMALTRGAAAVLQKPISRAQLKSSLADLGLQAGGRQQEGDLEVGRRLRERLAQRQGRAHKRGAGKR